MPYERKVDQGPRYLSIVGLIIYIYMKSFWHTKVRNSVKMNKYLNDNSLEKLGQKDTLNIIGNQEMQIKCHWDITSY